MKTIGILTMHRVVNYGSALQAWATQEIVTRLGYDAKLIDYVYPNEYHKSFAPPISCKLRIARMVMDILYNKPMKRKKEAFANFRNRHFNCTKMFDTAEVLWNSCPRFDIYLAGSDQIWNPDSFHDDYSFFLDFAPKNSTKISYASSFSKSKLSHSNAKKIASLLENFRSISVREKNAQRIVKKIIGRDVPICLDPSLMLEKKDYEPLIKESSITVDGEYILVYVLNYAFNPYPFATQFIEKLSRDTGLPVVCIDFSARERLHVVHCTHLHDAIGPSEFLWLFAHASFIVTTSFHGTAFALNFGKEFYSIVNNEKTGDDRMVSLLNQCGADGHIVVKDSNLSNIYNGVNKENVRRNLQKLRQQSIAYLKQSIQ